MSDDRPSDDLDALAAETRRIWDRNAAWWSEQTGEGNQFQREIVGPATERLLAVQPGETVLDATCGNGAFARRLAAGGARAVAFDFSERFIAIARERTTEHADRIAYRVLDATDPAALATLGDGRFDAAVCTMALMDMATIAPLLAALGRALKPGGRFVFSVSHPCFNSRGTAIAVEETDREGELVAVYAVKVRNYLGLRPGKGIGILGQPEPHLYFDRPLHALFGACFRAGFVLDGLEEPASGGTPRPERPFSWSNFADIPPALVARMRLPPS